MLPEWQDTASYEPRVPMHAASPRGEVCDKTLHRLLCYINQYPDICMYSVVGDTLDKVQLVDFTDADFAGDPVTLRSTSGVFLCLVGPNTFCPLSAVSKKQSCVSDSTPEAEIVALDLAVPSEGIPAILLWEALTQKQQSVRVMEGNTASARVIQTGKNPTMRHLGRTKYA